MSTKAGCFSRRQNKIFMDYRNIRIVVRVFKRVWSGLTVFFYINSKRSWRRERGGKGTSAWIAEGPSTPKGAVDIVIPMTIETRYIIFPEGEIQEIGHLLSIDDLVDVNGFPLELPLRTEKTLAYRVTKIRRREERGELDILHYLDLVPASDLLAYIR